MRSKLSYIREFLKRADSLLFAICLISAIFGIVIISSATKSFESSKYLWVQISAAILGIVLYIVFTVIDADIIADRWPILAVAEIVLLLLLIPFGVEESGNSGWIRFFGIGIQPTEIVKVIFILLLAKHIAYLKEYKNLNSVLSIGQLAAHFLVLFLLILVVSSDLGSALVFLFIFIVMMFAAGVKIYWFLFGAAGMAVVIPLAWTHFFTDRQKERILAPYDATIDPQGFDVNWQTSQAKLALASGRATGTGLYQGTQTQSSLVDSKHADFVFSSAGEELGMVGCCIIIALLCIIIIRCAVVGAKSRSTFGMLICFGAVGMLFFQTFENIGMCLGLTPVIGLTLPFFSYGGSSIVAAFAAVGLVSGVHYRPKPLHSLQQY